MNAPVRVLAAGHRMKYWIKIVLSVSLLSSVGITHQVFAGSAFPCALQWQPCPDAGVAGYALYYGVSGFPITNRMDVGSGTAVTVNNLTAPSTYSFYVVAYDANQVESDPSNLLLYNTLAISSLELSQLSDGNVNISFLVAPGAGCHVEYTETLNPPAWTVLTTATADSNGRVTISDPTVGTARFYRGVVP